MFTSRLRLLAMALLTASTAAACVTINIYFPAAAAEKAADRIIDEVWQAREAGKASQPAAGADSATAAQPEE